ncbi:hypothetical protein BT96DRAFT_1008593 [Gymnopus androsaceus JB14]|uniref:Uncharacterized protein n=1 Tax=Gymnopus androsaceus JB14 TaxID=1447944 RepID=A0A6A4GF33_9AGAR|nr:hypothetical protein BT96DRAFT_1008593 [Gymnopus androsaceus JB14]
MSETNKEEEELEQEAVPRLPTPPRETTPALKEMARRPFNQVQLLVVTPMPRNLPKEEKITLRGRIEENVVAQTPKFKLQNVLHQEGLAERLAARLYSQNVELMEAELLAIAPEVCKIMIQKAKNQQVKPRTWESAEVFTLSEPGEMVKPCGVHILSKYLDVNDMYMPAEDMFEVLTEKRNGLKVGSIVQKDPIQCFKYDMNEDDEQKDMIVVAHQGNGLQVMYPSINGKKADIELTLDSSSQIVAIDRVIAIGLTISRDPTFTIQMQDVHGGIQRTLGLAKNVAFKFGHVT